VGWSKKEAFTVLAQDFICERRLIWEMLKVYYGEHESVIVPRSPTSRQPWEELNAPRDSS
jgi:hypothetical protein